MLWFQFCHSYYHINFRLYISIILLAAMWSICALARSLILTPIYFCLLDICAAYVCVVVSWLTPSKHDTKGGYSSLLSFVIIVDPYFFYHHFNESRFFMCLDDLLTPFSWFLAKSLARWNFLLLDERLGKKCFNSLFRSKHLGSILVLTPLWHWMK